MSFQTNLLINLLLKFFVKDQVYSWKIYASNVSYVNVAVKEGATFFQLDNISNSDKAILLPYERRIMMSLIIKINDIIDICKKEGKNSCPHAPSIIALLEQMKDVYIKRNNDNEIKRQINAGIGKIVMDNMSFAESKLGSLILEIATEFRLTCLNKEDI